MLRCRSKGPQAKAVTIYRSMYVGGVVSCDGYECGHEYVSTPSLPARLIGTHSRGYRNPPPFFARPPRFPTHHRTYSVLFVQDQDKGLWQFNHGHLHHSTRLKDPTAQRGRSPRHPACFLGYVLGTRLQGTYFAR